jgi:dTDP-4-dehydrorhamnose reductase
MKILLFGKNGQVGFELQRSLEPLGIIKTLGSKELDITDFNELKNCIRLFSPDVIVNAAAYTAVDAAETNQDLAYAVNAEAVKIIAHEAKLLNAWFVHYSTDYVFDGTKTSPYIETDKTAPLSVYGRSKEGGENAIIDSNCKHLILRTSWAYGRHGSNFAKTILKLAKERDSLSIVSDQFGAPTRADLIADVTALMLYRIFDKNLNDDYSGVYHLVASGKTSWYEFACKVIKDAIFAGVELKCTADRVVPIISSEYACAATRPKNSLLDTTKLTKQFGLVMPSWERCNQFISFMS